MNLLCTERFKSEFERLKRKKPYRNLQQELIDYFIDKETSDLENGSRINGNDINAYIKKRLEGSGGYRVYYYIITAKGNVYLMFVHPKTGPDGSENIKKGSISLFLEETIEGIKTGKLYKVSAKDGELIFEKPKATDA